MHQNCWQRCNRAAARDAKKKSRSAHAPALVHTNGTPIHGVHSTNVLREVIMVNQPQEPFIFNSSHVRDYEYSVQVNHWFLKPIGAWPKISEISKTERLFAKLLNITCHSLIIFTFVPCVMYICFEDVAMDARMKAIGPMSHWLMGELNYCCLLMRSDDIAHCAKHVQRDWQTVRKAGDREIMLRNAKVGRFIACVSALCMHLGVFTYFVFNSFRKIVFRVGNDSYSMYQLPCPVYTKLMDVRFSPANEIVFALQLLTGFVVNSITVGACGMAAFLAMHACGQLNVVMSKLDKLVNVNTEVEEEKIAQQKLGIIVEHHLRTLSFVWYIERVMHLICLVELVGCTLNMCMLEYYILTEKSKQTVVSYSILYAAMTFNIFIFCYIGEILTEECKKVGERVYLIEWHQLPYKTMRDLIMIISRSSVVIKITAGKLMRMSIATLGDVFKASFAYFNMLRTVAM